MILQCERVERVPQLAVAIRTHTAVQDLPQVLGESYGLLATYLGEIGVTPAGAPFVAYYTMDMTNLDIEMRMPVAQPLPGRDTIQASSIPGGPAACCLYVGPYSEIRGAYDALTRWVADQRLEPTGVAYEHYLNDPASTPPAELQTEIVFPLKPPA